VLDGLAAARRRRGLLGALVALVALVSPAAAGAASYDHAFRVTALRGTVIADVTLAQRATEETPPVQLYDGHGTVRLGLQPSAPASAAGHLRWNPGAGGAIAVPAALRFAWNETASRGDTNGASRRCTGRSRAAIPRRLVHVLRVVRNGAQVRVRWAIPLPRLGAFGCAGAGTLPAVVGEDVYAASTFDHRQVRLGVQGSHQQRRAVAGGRTRTTVVSWAFTLTLAQS
jgi:hypothetical protein